MSWRRRAASLILVAVAALLGPGLAGVFAPAHAHPLGNASVNHYDGLRLFRDHVEDLAVEDVAEIPTYQRQDAIDADGDGSPSAAERSDYAARQCEDLASAARLRVGGTRRPLTVTSATYAEKESKAVPGLTVGRLECRLTAEADLTETTTVEFRNEWDGAGIGWHEITAVGKGVSLKDSPVPPKSISDALRQYPNDLLSNPLDVRRMSVHTRPVAGQSTYQEAQDIPVAGFFVRQVSRLADTFTGLVGSQHLTLGVGVLAVVLALALGAGHAMLPGHGKTIMAAYVVGKRGRLRDVVAVGATVTLTHTAGVLVLGLLLTTSTAVFAPTAIEQALAAVSGVIIVGVGVALVVNAVRRRAPRHLETELAQVDAQAAALADAPIDEDAAGGPGARRSLEAEVAAAHARAGASAPGREATAGDVELVAPHASGDHGHGHDHAHGLDHQHRQSHRHDHQHGQGHGHGRENAFSKGGLLGLGIAGGLVPSPSALLVLLGAVSLGRTVFGVLLVLAYGVGMAVTLSGAALALVRVRERVGRVGAGSRFRRFERLAGWAPVLTAVLVIVVGLGVTLRAVSGTV